MPKVIWLDIFYNNKSSEDIVSEKKDISIAKSNTKCYTDEELYEFEWDDEKNHSNMLKHGINFATAALVFRDEARIEIYDEAHSDEEDRYIVIGKVHKVLFVVYTERNNITRIISARLATPKERRIYYDNI